MPTTKRDYYEILGVAETASKGVIQKAYERLKNRCSSARELSKLELAYKVLSDAKLRQWYNQHRFDAVLNDKRKTIPLEIFLKQLRNQRYHEF